MLLRVAVAFGLAALLWAPARAEGLRAGAAPEVLTADDSMVIGGGILPGKAKGQEGEIRASALVVEGPAGEQVCLVACDVLMVARDVLDRAEHRIEAATGIPFDHILINATHTHHAPTTVTVHGYQRDETFTRQFEDNVVQAATAAFRKRVPVTMRFRLGEESSVGRNSRLFLADGTMFWVGPRDDALRPTGPFDPELPVVAFRRSDGSNEAVLFNHSTHTIGTLTPGVRSPSFYGLAAQSLEHDLGGTFLFFEGASGSTHNLDVPAREAKLRIEQAVKDALAAATTRDVPRIRALKREITFQVRGFDDAAEDANVYFYCNRRTPNPIPTVEVFRSMRRQLASQRGQQRKTWVQAIVIGDIAIVGIPGEFFTVLGQEIKRRSPYRYTYVFELANDYIGYIPDARSYDSGGYQVWTGLHSFVERGTGEQIVDEAAKLLETLARTE